MQHLRIELPVLADEDVEDVLDLVTSVDGVILAEAEGATVHALAEDVDCVPVIQAALAYVLDETDPVHA